MQRVHTHALRENPASSRGLYACIYEPRYARDCPELVEILSSFAHRMRLGGEAANWTSAVSFPRACRKNLGSFFFHHNVVRNICEIRLLKLLPDSPCPFMGLPKKSYRRAVTVLMRSLSYCFIYSLCFVNGKNRTINYYYYYSTDLVFKIFLRCFRFAVLCRLFIVSIFINNCKCNLVFHILETKRLWIYICMNFFTVKRFYVYLLKHLVSQENKFYGRFYSHQIYVLNVRIWIVASYGRNARRLFVEKNSAVY